MLCLTSSSSSAPAPLLPSLADRPSPGIAGGGGNVRLSVVSSPRRSWPGKATPVPCRSLGRQPQNPDTPPPTTSPPAAPLPFAAGGSTSFPLSRWRRRVLPG
uniref:Uncharacterized protein n=1 Tax=Oryza glumipatula TaxID=40148 RepID=A0A0E0AEM4_9ORYZ